VIGLQPQIPAIICRLSIWRTRQLLFNKDVTSDVELPVSQTVALDTQSVKSLSTSIAQN
jgi:hypothetical protein